MKFLLIEGRDNGKDLDLNRLNSILVDIVEFKSFPENRVGGIIRYIESNALEASDIYTKSRYYTLSELEYVFDVSKNIILRLSEKDRYLIQGIDGKRTVVRIVDIDTSRKWCIKDGRVYYYDEVCLNEVLNMFEILEERV